MAIVNYVREHTRFIEYASDEHLTASERLLWYALMHIMNQRAQGRVWPDEFIRVSNDRLLTYCPMKYDTLAAARNSLKQRGLIEFTKGEKNKQSPAYRVIYFYPEYAAPDTEADADRAARYPEKSEYTGGNTGGNIGGNSGDFILNNNNTEKRIPSEIEEDEEDDNELTRARKEAETAWMACFGAEIQKVRADILSRMASAAGFGPGVISEAVRLAATWSDGNPYAYALKTLQDWRDRRIRTAEDAQEYQFVRDVVKGREPGNIGPDEGPEMMREFERKMRDRQGERDA